MAVGRQAAIDALSIYRPEQIALAGEGTGAIMMPQFRFVYDGIAAMLAVLSMMRERSAKLSAILASYPKYSILKGTVPLVTHRIPALLAAMRERHHDGTRERRGRAESRLAGSLVPCPCQPDRAGCAHHLRAARRGPSRVVRVARRTSPELCLMPRREHLLKIGVSGIRGVVGEFLTPTLACSFAQAFGTYVGGGRVVLGRDTRASGEMLTHAVACGLLAAGCEVVEVGILPTPTIMMYVADTRAQGGIAVTASHNPPEYNALKLFNAQGLFFNNYERAELIDLYHQSDFQPGHQRRDAPCQHGLRVCFQTAFPQSAGARGCWPHPRAASSASRSMP